MNQGEVLSRTWKLLWKHKVLYLLGLISMLISSAPGIVPSFFLYITPKAFENWANSITVSIQTVPITGWVLIGLGLLVFAAVILYLTLSFKAAQLRGAWQADTAEPQQLSFGQLWQEGQPYVLRMILFSLIVGGVSLAGWMAVISPLYNGNISKALWLNCLIFPVMLILAAATLIIQCLLQLGYDAIIAEDLGVIAAIRRAWNVAIHHKAALALLTFFLFLINIGGSALIQAPFMSLAAISSISATEQSSNLAPLVISGIMTLALILYAGLWMSFNDTAWLLAYNQLTRPVDPAPVDAEPPQIQG